MGPAKVSQRFGPHAWPSTLPGAAALQTLAVGTVPGTGRQRARERGPIPDGDWAGESSGSGSGSSSGSSSVSRAARHPSPPLQGRGLLLGPMAKLRPPPRQEPLGNCTSRSKAVRAPDSSAAFPDRLDLSTLAEPGGASPPCGLRAETGTCGSLLPTSGPGPCCNPDLPCDQRLWTLVRLVHVRPQGSTSIALCFWVPAPKR